MKKVILCADKTCDLGQELEQKFNVHTIPYHINLEGTEYYDNVNITTDEIYKAYYDKKVLPKTSAVSIGEFQDFWKPYLDEGCEIIHINLGSSISATHRNCTLAAEECEGVYAIDSQNLSTGTGHLVIEAAKMIESGMEARDIAEKLREMTDKVHTSFILDNLTFMAAGGRCSTVAALGANLLKLKPCIEVDNQHGSAMAVAKKYRGNLDAVLKQYVKEQLSKYDNIATDKIFITYTAMEEKYVEIVRQAVEEAVHFDNVYETTASCTIGSHCGPNCLGILFMTK